MNHCGVCGVSWEGWHHCQAASCTQCGRRIAGQQFERDGYLFCSQSHRAEWGRIDAPQELTPGSKPL